MKGRNKMLLNEETLVEAVQEYLDKRSAGYKGPVVERVITTANGDEFEVHLNADADRPGPQLPAKQ